MVEQEGALLMAKKQALPGEAVPDQRSREGKNRHGRVQVVDRGVVPGQVVVSWVYGVQLEDAFAHCRM